MLAVVLVLAPAAVAQAGDPLDDTDGTENWDQVVEAKAKKKGDREEKTQVKQEIADWEGIRQMWEGARESYLSEKAIHLHLSDLMKAKHQKGKKEEVLPGEPITPAESGWGDDSGRPLYVPDGALDKAIDGELGNAAGAKGSGKRGSSGSAGATGTTGSHPSRPSENEAQTQGDGTMPSSFKQPVEADDDSGAPPATTGKKSVNASPDEEDAKATAQMMKQQRAAEEEKRRQDKLDERRRREDEEKARKKATEDEKARKKVEEAEAAAAAAQLLKQQEEDIKKEQEALQKKAKLKTDSDGQMVDPELQHDEQEQDSPKKH